MRKFQLMAPPVARAMIASSEVTPQAERPENGAPAVEQPVAYVSANTVLKGLKVGRNRKHRQAIIAGMAKQANAKK